jgi:hypothetical protein
MAENTTQKMLDAELEKLRARVKRTTGEELVRQGGLVARAAAPAAVGAMMGIPGGPVGMALGAGVGSLAGPLSDVAVAGYNAITGSNQGAPSQAFEQLLTRAGLPEPETSIERVTQQGVRGAFDAYTGAGALKAGLQSAPALTGATASKNIMQLLAQQPGAQAAAGALGGTAAATAGEMGAGPVTSMVAGTAAGTLPSLRPNHILPNQASPNRQAMNQLLQELGVPLSPAQQLASTPGQVAESVMKYLPTSAPAVARMEDMQGRANTAAAFRMAGQNADNALPETLQRVQQDFGRRFDRLDEATMVQPDIEFGQGMQRVQQGYVRGLNDQQRELFDDTVAQLQQFVNGRAQGAVMPGVNYRMVDGELRETAARALRSDDPSILQYGRAISALRDELQALMERSAVRQQSTQIGEQPLSGAGLAEAWRETNRDYARFQRIVEAMGRAGGQEKLNSGFISPRQLAAAERASIGPQRYAMSDDPFTRFVRAGEAVLPDPVPNSGTAQRSFMQDLMTGGRRGAPAAAAGAGANAAGIAAIDPVSSLGLPYLISRNWYAPRTSGEALGLLASQSLRGAAGATNRER